MRRVVLVSLTGVLAGGGVAQGATTLGASVAEPGTPVEISGSPGQSGTAVNTAIPGRTIVAPASGVITRWRVGGSSGQLRLVVVQGAAGSRSVAGASKFETGGGNVLTFNTTGLSIQAGQLVGLELGAGASAGLVYREGSRLERYIPPLGSMPRPPDYVNDPAESFFVFNADVEPDADGDGLGDETQDPNPPGGGTNGGTTSSLKINSVKAKKQRRSDRQEIVLQFRVRNSSSSDVAGVKACVKLPKGYKPSYSSGNRGEGISISGRKICWKRTIVAGSNDGYLVQANTPSKAGKHKVKIVVTAGGGTLTKSATLRVSSKKA